MCNSYDPKFLPLLLSCNFLIKYKPVYRDEFCNLADALSMVKFGRSFDDGTTQENWLGSIEYLENLAIVEDKWNTHNALLNTDWAFVFL